MVAIFCGYSGPPFKGYRGVTQGDPFYPNIFNVVEDTVTSHWLKLVVPTEARVEGLGEIIEELAVFLCG